MTSHETIRDARDYINYAFHISARGAAEVTSDIMGMSNNIQYMLGQLAWKTSEYLGQAEGTAISMATAAIGAFAAATESAAKYEQAIASVEAISGRQVSKELVSEKAIQMSNQFGMNVEQMTGGLESLARAGVTANQSIEALLESSVQMSKFEGRDLEESINSLLSTTNLLNPDLDVNSDEFAKTVKDLNQQIISTSESSPINAKNIMDTLQHVGGYASAASLDQEDLFATIAQLGAKGTKGEIAGTSLRAFVSAGQKDTAQRALDKIGLNVSDLWDDSGNAMLPVSEMKQVLDDALNASGYSKQEKLEFYSDFVGYKQANQIMKIDTKEVDKYKEKISGAMSLTDKMGIILGTTQGNWQQLVETTRNFMLQVGQHVLKFLNPIVWGVKIIAKVLSAIPGSTQLAAIGLGLVAIKGVAVTINILLPTLLSFLNKFSDTSLNLKNFFSQLRSDLEKSKEIITSLGDSAKMNQIVNQREQEIGEKKLQKDYEELALQEYFRATQGYIGHYMKGNVIYDAQTNQEVAEQYVTDRGEKKYRALRDFGNVHQGDVTDDYTSFGINLFKKRTSNWDLYSKEKKALVRNQQRPEQKYLDPIIEYLKTRDLAEAHADSKKVKESAQLNGGPVFAFGEDGGISLGNIISSINNGVTASAFDAEMDHMNKILKNIERYARRLRDISEQEEQYRERVRNENNQRQESRTEASIPQNNRDRNRQQREASYHDYLSPNFKRSRSDTPEKIIIHDPKIINTQSTRFLDPQDKGSGAVYNILDGGRKSYVRDYDRKNIRIDAPNNNVNMMDYSPVNSRRQVYKTIDKFLTEGKMSSEIHDDFYKSAYGLSSGRGMEINVPNIITYNSAFDSAQQMKETFSHEITHQLDKPGRLYNKKQELDGKVSWGGYDGERGSSTITRELNANIVALHSMNPENMTNSPFSETKSNHIQSMSTLIERNAIIGQLAGRDTADISTDFISATIEGLENRQLEYLKAIQIMLDNDSEIVKGYNNYKKYAKRTHQPVLSKREYLDIVADTKKEIDNEIKNLEINLYNLETLRKHGADIQKIMDDANLSNITKKIISKNNNKTTLTPYNYTQAESAQEVQKGMDYIKNKIQTYTGNGGREAIKQDMVKAIHPSGYSQESMRVGIERGDWALHDYFNYTKTKKQKDYKQNERGNYVDRNDNELIFTDEIWYDDAFTNTNRRAMKASDFMGGDFTTQSFKYGRGENAWGRKFIDSQGNARYAQIGKGKNLKIVPMEDLEYDEEGHVKDKYYENAMFTEKEEAYYSDAARTNKVNLSEYSDDLKIIDREKYVPEPAGMFPNETLDYIGKAILFDKDNMLADNVSVMAGAMRTAHGITTHSMDSNENNKHYDVALLKTMFKNVDPETGNIMETDDNGNITDNVKYYFNPYTFGYQKYGINDINVDDFGEEGEKFTFTKEEILAEKDAQGRQKYKKDAMGNYQSASGDIVFYATNDKNKFFGAQASEKPSQDEVAAELFRGGVRTKEDARKVYQGNIATEAGKNSVMTKMSNLWYSKAGPQLFQHKDNLNKVLRSIGRKDDFIAIKNIMKSDYGADLSNFSQNYGNSEEQIKDIVTWVEENLETAEEKEEAIGKFVDVLMKHEDTAAKTLEAVNFNPAGKSHMNTVKGFSEYLTQNIVDGGENRYGGYQGNRSAAKIMQDYGFNPEDALDIFNIQGASSGYGYFMQMRENLMKNMQQRLGRELNEAEIRQVDGLLDELTKEYFAPEIIPDLGTMGRYNPKVAYEGVRTHANAAGVPMIGDEEPIIRNRDETPNHEEIHDENDGENDSSNNRRRRRHRRERNEDDTEENTEGNIGSMFSMWDEAEELNKKAKDKYGYSPATDTIFYEIELNKKRAQENNTPQNRLNRYANQLSPTMIDAEMQKTSAAIKQHGLNIISALSPLTEGLERASGWMNRIAQTFPIFAPVAGVFNKITDTVGGFTNGIMSVVGFFDSMAEFKTKLPESWQKMLGGIVSKINTIPLFNQIKSKILKGGEKVLGGVDKLIDGIAGFIENHPAIAAAAVALVATIGIALMASKKHHDNQIKEINEETKKLKGEKKAARAEYYSSAKTLRSGAGKPWDREIAKINFETAANKLEAINAKEQMLVQKQYNANRSIWGEYGSINQMKLGLEWTGLVEGDHYGDKHETTTKAVRDITENALRDKTQDRLLAGSPGIGSNVKLIGKAMGLEDNPESRQVAAFYKANEQEFIKMERNEDVLNRLYNTETALIHKYGSKEAARQSGEWDKAARATAAEMGGGTTKEEVEADVAMMQTNYIVEQGTEQMKANLDSVKNEAIANAYMKSTAGYGKDMEWSDKNNTKMADIMLDANAKELANQAKVDMYWQAATMTLMGIAEILMNIMGLVTFVPELIMALVEGFDRDGISGAIDSAGALVNEKYTNMVNAVGEVQGGLEIGSAAQQITAENVKKGTDLQKSELNRRNNKDYGTLDLSSKWFNLGNKVGINPEIAGALGNEAQTTGQNTEGNTGQSTPEQVKDETKKQQDKSESSEKTYDNKKSKSILDTLYKFSMPGYIENGAKIMEEGILTGGKSMGWRDLLELNPVGYLSSNLYNSIFGDDSGESESELLSNTREQAKDKQKIAETLQNNDITIETININTEDDPEKIKTALMNLIIELQKDTTDVAVSTLLNSIKTNTTGESSNTNTKKDNDKTTGA